MSAETTSVAGARAFVDAMIAHNKQVRAEVEQAAAGLTGAGVTGPVLDGLHALAGHYAETSPRWEALSTALKAHEALAETARATQGAATDTSFYTDDSSGKGRPMTSPATPGNDSGDAAPQQPGRTVGGYHQCATCGYVVDRSEQPPRRCWNCQTVDGEWTPAETFFPDRPGDDAVAADTRDLEATIRDTYARLAREHGDGVPLTALRAALPEGLDRAQVDAALSKLAAHSDVSLEPRTAQKLADDTTQHAAVATGASYAHTLRIHRDRSMADTAQRINMTTRRQAESMLAPLSDRDVAHLADKMGVDTNGTTEQLRERIAERADRNRAEWLADAEQGRLDGTLLYRADTEPEWVATWTDEDRQAAAAAAARLQHRAATEESWAYVKDRADRWANPQPAPATA